MISSNLFTKVIATYSIPPKTFKQKAKNKSMQKTTLTLVLILILALTAFLTFSHKTNILVIGQDLGLESDYNNVPRADAIFIIQLSPIKPIKIFRIPRDTLVYLGPEYSTTQIALAPPYTGQENTITIIEKLLNIKIHHYMFINLTSIQQILETIEPIDMYIDEDIYYHDKFQNFTINLKKGEQKLNAIQALGYLKFRMHMNGEFDTDLQRINRQEKLLKAILKNKRKLIANANKILNILEQTDTSLTKPKIIHLALLNFPKPVHFKTLPGTPTICLLYTSPSPRD